MGRLKIRNYPSRESCKGGMKDWLIGHKIDCKNLLLKKFGNGGNDYEM